MPTTLFLINKGSGRKHNAEKVGEELMRVYAEKGKIAQIAWIDFEKLDALLESAIRQGIRRIFAIGGDGTVNAIGSRLVGSTVEFGVIPTGSGNGFARHAGFSTHTSLAIKQSLDTVVRQIDTATFNGVPFLNVAGIGAEAEVLAAFSKLGQRGFLPYLKSTLQTLLHLHTFSAKITLDGVELQRSELVSVIVANGRQWGYDMRVTPRARMTDGLLNVLILHHFPLLDVAPLTHKMLMGDLARSRYVEAFEAKHVVVETSDTVNGHIDGEFMPCSPATTIRILPASLNLLLPASLTPEKVDCL